MKETVTEYETVEKTEERVLCDTCGSDCTDDHAIAPSHVCPDCQDDMTMFESLEQFANEMLDGDASKEWPLWKDMLFIGILYPLCVPFALSMDPNDDAQVFLATTFGMLLWVVTPLLAYFLVIA